MSWAPTQGPSAAPRRAPPLSPLMTSASTAAAASASPGPGFSPAAPRSSAGSQTAPDMCLGTRRSGREHSTLWLLSPVGLVLCVHALRPGHFLLSHARSIVLSDSLTKQKSRDKGGFHDGDDRALDQVQGPSARGTLCDSPCPQRRL